MIKNMLVVWIVTCLKRQKLQKIINQNYLKIMFNFNSFKFKKCNIIQKLNKLLNINVFVDQSMHIRIGLFTILNYIVKTNIKMKNMFTSNLLNIISKITILFEDISKTC